MFSRLRNPWIRSFSAQGKPQYQWRQDVSKAKSEKSMEQISHLRGSGGAGAARGWGDHAHIGVHAPLSLVLVYAIPLHFRKIEKILHGPQVYQKRLRGCPRVFFLTENLGQQSLIKLKIGRVISAGVCFCLPPSPLLFTVAAGCEWGQEPKSNSWGFSSRMVWWEHACLLGAVPYFEPFCSDTLSSL